MSVYALVDCDHFYVSCQRLFDPALEKRPVVVLSNNDGCVISRSPEAKKLGIPMGAPYFKYRRLCEQNKVVVFSSNYELYGDLSQRVMTSLRQFCPDIEVYSIDEAFLRLDGFSHLDLTDYCTKIAGKIKMWTGIPVSIGIGPSKTLAKAATHLAKKNYQEKVFDLRNPSVQDSVLAQIDVNDVWGIGHRLTQKLTRLGITTAQQLRDSPTNQIRQKFGVMVERTLLELNGIACFSLETDQPKKTIISSRSFGHPVNQLTELEEAISHFAAIACAKLRKQQSKTHSIYVFLQTNLFSLRETPYSNGIMHGFAEPCAHTDAVIQAAKKILKQIFIPGLGYKKAGVMLMNIIPAARRQHDLFIDPCSQDKKNHLMQVIDTINDRMGRDSIFMAAEGVHRSWRMQANLKTASFTTHWHDILTIDI